MSRAIRRLLAAGLAGVAAWAVLGGARWSDGADGGDGPGGMGGPNALNGRPGPSPLDRAVPPTALPLLHEPAQRFDPGALLGRPWVLNVWASWCAPCRDEHPLWRDVAATAPAPIVGLAHRDDPRDADEWLRRLGNPYATVVLDRDGAAGRAWGLTGVPATYVVDATGVVRWAHAGPMTAALWQREVLPRLQAAR